MCSLNVSIVASLAGPITSHATRRTMAACLLAWDTFELLNRWTVLVLPRQPLFGKRLVIYLLPSKGTTHLGYPRLHVCMCLKRGETEWKTLHARTAYCVYFDLWMGLKPRWSMVQTRDRPLTGALYLVSLRIEAFPFPGRERPRTALDDGHVITYFWVTVIVIPSHVSPLGVAQLPARPSFNICQIITRRVSLFSRPRSLPSVRIMSQVIHHKSCRKKCRLISNSFRLRV